MSSMSGSLRPSIPAKSSCLTVHIISTVSFHFIIFQKKITREKINALQYRGKIKKDNQKFITNKKNKCLFCFLPQKLNLHEFLKMLWEWVCFIQVHSFDSEFKLWFFSKKHKNVKKENRDILENSLPPLRSFDHWACPPFSQWFWTFGARKRAWRARRFARRTQCRSSFNCLEAQRQEKSTRWAYFFEGGSSGIIF